MKSAHCLWSIFPTVVVSASTAYAAHYLSLQEAQKLFFDSADKFFEVSISPELRQPFLDQIGSEKTNPRVFLAKSEQNSLGYVVVDEVIGKHELITYAVSLSLDAKIRRIEILEYRETKGDEINTLSWKRQFEGKSAQDQLAIDQDISNISGATLSCQHVTQGIKRILNLIQEIAKDVRN